jgi:hypothetical protein
MPSTAPPTSPSKTQAAKPTIKLKLSQPKSGT